MPGSTPATSQLDWLSSTTAMIVLSWSKATRDLLKSFSWGIGALRQLFASDDGGISSPPAPYHLSAAGKRIRTIGPAPAQGSSGRCQSETAARREEALTGSGPRRQCLPGVAPHSLSLRGGTASSNPSSSSKQPVVRTGDIGNET